MTTSLSRWRRVLPAPDDFTPGAGLDEGMPATSTITAPSSSRPTAGNPVKMRRALVVLRQFALVALGSLVLGGLTSYAQTFLPDALRPFANSASGWTLLTALMVGLFRARTAPSAVFGATSFVLLVLGYQFVSGLRGFPTSETLFLIIGVVVGPFVGVAASWLHRGGWRSILGCGVLAGIAVGEGAYGLIMVMESTGWFYWTLIGLVGVAVLVHVVVCRLHVTSARVVAVALVAVVAVVFFFAYLAAGRIGGLPPGSDLSSYLTVVE